MIDWHSHILPGMDDGSRNVAESIALLKMQAEQGVDTVVATPHFYANDETVASFLKRRRDAFALLKANLPDNAPEIHLGAEVRYYQGISRLVGLKDLKVEGSPVLLVEMPMSRWSESMVRELMEISSISGVKLALAHIDRYLRLQSRDVWTRIYDSDFLIQVNASFFTAWGTRRKAMSLLTNGCIQMIGSDCHNLTSRPPQIGSAFGIIQKKLGSDYLSEMNEYGRGLLVK